MKSPFPGWEQGTILEMRDDPRCLQAFLGGCANDRAEGRTWFVTPAALLEEQEGHGAFRGQYGQEVQARGSGNGASPSIPRAGACR